MGEDTPSTPDTVSPQLQKLDEDKPLDFRFHAAYMAYSKAWDENSSEEARAKLNELISSLKEDDSNYEMFYSSLGQFRKDRTEYQGQSRTRIRVQRKMEWRKSEARNARNARHKK